MLWSVLGTRQLFLRLYGFLSRFEDLLHCYGNNPAILARLDEINAGMDRGAP